MEFSLPEYWGGEPFSSPGDLPLPGIEPGSPTLQADYLEFEPRENPMHNHEGSIHQKDITIIKYLIIEF